MNGARNAPVQIETYPGAYHDFDWPDLPIRRHPENRTKTGVVPITGTDPAARDDALERVPAFLEGYLF
jgi:dienelactone hydrolase